MNKSVSKDVFKGKLSIVILLLFYLSSFGLIGGLTTYNDKEKDAANKLVVTERNIGQGYLVPGEISLQNYSDYKGEFNEDIKNREWENLYFSFFNTINNQDVFYEELIEPLILNSSNYDYLFNDLTFNEYVKTYYYYWYQYYQNDLFPEIIDFESLNALANDFWETSYIGADFFGNIENVIGIYLFYKNIINENYNGKTDEENNSDPDQELNNIYNLFGTIDYDIQLQYTYSNPFSENNDQEGSSQSYLFLGYNNTEETDSVLNSHLRSQYGIYSQKLDVPIINENFTNYSDQDLLNEVFGADYDSSTDSIYGNGTSQNPYKVLMLDDYYQANKNFFETNDNKYMIGPYYFEVVATGWFPNVSYPVHNLDNILTDVKNEQTLMINNYALANIANGNQDFVIYYGSEEIYNQINDYSDIISGSISDDIEEQAWYITKYAEGNYQNGYLRDDGYYDYSQHNEINDDSGDLIAARADSLLLEAEGDEAFISVFRFIFLLVVIIILILLIQKRINDSSKNLGTLKALGMSNLKISSSYIIYPIIITTIGSFIALLLAIPVGMYFVGLMTQYFAIPISTVPIFTFNSFLVVYISPLLIACGVSFLISYYVLSKPTLKLLQGAHKNKPGIITIYLGKLIPSSFSFSSSYKIKSLFRSTGKSFILFFSMIFSTFLIALSFSGTTMVNNVIDGAEEELNYQSVSSLNSDLNYLPINYNDDFDNWYQNVDNNQLNYNFEYSPIVWDFSTITSTTGEEKYQEMGDIILNSPLIYSYDELNNQYDISYLSAEGLLNYFYFLFNNPDVINYTNQNFEDTNISGSDLLVIDFSFWQYSYLNYLNYVNQTSANKLSALQFIEETLINYNPALGLESLSGIFVDDNLGIDYYQDIYVDINFGNYFYNSDQQSIIFSDQIEFETEDDNESFSLLSLNDIEEIENNMFHNIPDLTKAIDNFEAYQQNEVDQNGNYYLPIITSQYYYNQIKEIANYEGESQGHETYSGEIRYKDQSGNRKSKEITFVIVGTYGSYVSNAIYTTRDAISKSVNDQLSYIPYIIYSNDFYKQVYSFAFSYSLIQQILINNGDYDVSIEEILNNNYSIIEQATLDNDIVFHQIDSAYSLISGLLLIICAFAFFVAFVLISITIKVVADNSLNEVSMLKVFGYTNWKATSLVMTSYIIILALSFILSVSLIFAFLLGLSTLLTNLTGTTYKFTLTGFQLGILIALILVMIIILLIFVYITFAKQNPLDALKETIE
ncbi:FtsX-like permease family protein [Candidatus Hepatoplasma crinochetorum]|uniref:FtsX-like permease family protein n=1 Tax=Candidatus Hepatoplasma crinochetorum TaxID=295596 RepID=UPI003087DA84|nr:MAG: hypothetical protein HCTKY_0160 [Candidatus Hepatoplasma crinochetorum]